MIKGVQLSCHPSYNFRSCKMPVQFHIQYTNMVTCCNGRTSFYGLTSPNVKKLLLKAARFKRIQIYRITDSLSDCIRTKFAIQNCKLFDKEK